ncbi:adenylate/guanylate cyclase domain-containing protein [Flavobacterium sp. DGU38]|uniref:Adenylate/guanylate cyclase domain-containing protein n=1 Tax=Flavobacterium calami TaxID=3139144 RepID=A0ABU9INU9_9FLAO
MTKYTLKTSLKFKEYLQIVGLWISAFIFYIIMTYSIVDISFFRTEGFNVKDFLVAEITGAFFVGLFMGTNLFLLQEFLYPRFFRNCGILLTTLLRSFLFLISCFIGLLIIIELDKEQLIAIDDLLEMHPDAKWGVSFTFYCLAVHVFITLLQAFKRRLGKSYFKSLLIGNYRVPVVEYRVFMFLDMKCSAAVAEDAGHYNYSLLLQQCFSDLSELLAQYDAEVYQYVGDEAVLTWKVGQGFKREKCTAIFKAFTAGLLEKKEFYQARFGLVPKFKASLNEGMVTVAEIGRVKTEIAYHGDVLTTAARVRDLCSDQKADLLVTHSFFEQLPSLEKKNFSMIQTAVLRGKKKSVPIYKYCP